MDHSLHEPPWAGDLNEQQREAVFAPPGPVLVAAGPGSGKTRVVTYRILHLVEGLGVHPSTILAMTFTNKAAGEMKARLLEFLGSRIRLLWIGTFHATCSKLLRIYHDEAGVPEGFTILDEQDQLRILKTILRESFPEAAHLKPSSLRGRIEYAKRSSTGWSDFPEEGRDGRTVKEIYRRYEEYLAEHKALDFNDLILRCVGMLRSNKELRRGLSERFVHVLVDEFQDTDPLQYEFVRLMSSAHRNVFVVGDEDQSIYGWRGARVENMLGFVDDHERCAVYKLERNYRSTPGILDAANAVISRNRFRKAKTLWTEDAGGAPVRHVSCLDENDEARTIAAQLQDHAASGGRYGGCAVIYRVHAQSRAIEEALLERSIPYRIVGGVRFFERMEIKDLVSWMKLASDPGDDISFTRVLNVPPRGFGEGTLGKIREKAAREDVSLASAARMLVEARALPGRRAAALKGFVDLVRELHDLAGKLPPTELLERIVEAVGYEDYLASAYPESLETRLENAEELRAFAEEFVARNDEPSLPLLFDRIALQTSADSLDTKEDRVTLMTAHAAKGLEFDCVHVAGVEDGLFPYAHPSLYFKSRKEVEMEIEEDCRLLYVAMTRAREKLVLTSAATRRLFGGGTYQVGSPFLEGIPEGTIVASESDAGRVEGAASVHEEAGGACVESSVNGFRVGSDVKHRKFGKGRVVDVTPGVVDKITVKFKSGSVKEIIETFLERV